MRPKRGHFFERCLGTHYAAWHRREAVAVPLPRHSLSSSGTAHGLLGCSGTLGSNTQYSGGAVAAAALGDGGCTLADPPEQERGKCFLVCGLRSPAKLKSVWRFAVVSNARLCHPRTELRLSFLETAGDLPLEMPFFALDFAMIL